MSKGFFGKIFAIVILCEEVVGIMKIVEFSCYLSGPLTGKYLADMGFEVVCVTRPSDVRGYDDEREFVHHALHDLRRGKTVVQLDLRTSEGLNAAHSIVSTCDVVIENFGHGVAERLGVGFDACVKVNPNVVYASLPGYSRHDQHRSLRAWDSIVMASTGVFSDMGLNRTLRGVSASFSSLPMPSVYGSIFAALAIVTALFNRTPGPHFIEIPLASALSEALVHNSIQIPLDDRYRSRRALRIRDGPTPVSPEILEELLDPFFCRYVCQDNRPIYLVCPAHARHQTRALECLGISVTDLGIPVVDPYADGDAFGIGSGRLSEEQSRIIRPVMNAAFRKRPSVEWERDMGAMGIPIVAHRSCDEWIQTTHARESGLVGVDSRGRPTVGPLTWTNPVVDRDAQRSYRDQTMTSVRVLDLCNVIAGPTIGRMLARFGASVTKIDPVRPLYAPDVTVVYGVVVNMGKKSTLLDITSSFGRSVLERLIRDSDVILVNATSDCLTRLGLTDDTLRSLNPDAILTRFDAWGGPIEDGGDMSQFVGYDDNVQAGIGIMHRFGGGIDTVEEHAHIGTIDVIAGVAAAFGVVGALCERKYKRRIQQVRTSLAAVGQYLQYPFMFGRTFPSLGRGVTCRGVHPGHELVKCSDGWIVVVESPLPRPSSTLVRTHDLVKKETIRDACAILAGRNVSACPLRKLCDVVRDNRVACVSSQGGSYQYVTIEDHPIGCVVIVAPVAMRSDDVVWNTSMIAPKAGMHTKEVVEAVMRGCWWVTSNDVSSGWSRTYIPASTRCDVCVTQSAILSLSCEHNICCRCLERHRHSLTCPTCNRPHILDRSTLQSVTTQWRHSYGAWRKGFHRGSRDMERLYLPTTGATLRRSTSHPTFVESQRKTSRHLTSPTSTLSLSTTFNSGVNA